MQNDQSYVDKSGTGSQNAVSVALPATAGGSGPIGESSLGHLACASPNLVSLFHAQVKARPEAVALVERARAMTYADLETRANRVARLLIEKGVGPGDTVALLVERSITMIEAILGVLKTGAAYLPIDAATPRERTAFMVADTRPKTALTTIDLASRLPPDVDLVVVDDRSTIASLEARPVTSLEDKDRTAPLLPDHPAYVIYTSGSTGTPKGVVITHRNVVRLLSTTRESYGFTPTDVWILFHSYAFDVSVWEIWGALVHGGRLIIADSKLVRSPDALKAFLALHRVTVLNMTPSAFYQLAQADHEGFIGELALSLRIVILAGEALDVRRLSHWHARYAQTGQMTVNMYGTTETTVHAAIAAFPLRTAFDVSDNSIGRPLGDLSIHVLDEGLQPCANDTVGELYIAGAGLAQGYQARPALTASRFVANPFGHALGERLYRTGDLAVRRADGQLVFHGRADDQVKIRGYRIEPREIETVLTTCPSIAQAAVIVREDTPGDRRLVAYLVLSRDRAGNGRVIDMASLRAHLTERLPDYMLPTAYVTMDGLPLTVNGKLDRRALPSPKSCGVLASYVAPTTAEETLLCDLVANLFGVERVGLADNFFHLGGHSLLAIRLAAQVRSRLGRELPVHAVFETPILGDLASRIGVVDASSAAFDVLLPLRRAGNLPPLFCLHPVGGLCWPYMTLLPFISDAQPIHGLQALGWQSENALPGNIDAVLGACHRALQSVAPTGPVRLLGWSFGGILAHLLSTRLQAEGRTIDKLIIFDAYPPLPSPGREYEYDPRTDAVWRDLAINMDLDIPPELADVPLNGQTIHSIARASSHFLATLTMPQQHRFAAVMANNTRFMPQIVFDKFDGPMTFVAANRRPPGFDSAQMNPARWRPFCAGNIETCTIDSTHNQMLTRESLSQIPWLHDLGSL
ncbi:amino acid adenylation domain-containing protein [Paraburkholderia domus]|jgi:amino acid adenylation domain|uniref:amino acid adenylation domain-containing protein n=1 Tax=Paraburkholderia domus TaxID=2793075 RepID=UPI001913A7CE|nr:amino acid adenylation domain-containing protein [Paraburkholderia domus]MBK5066196.1 amino acid adenylation domain-containing protein [Burkholderia sp. R-70199]CAE6968493.1 Dimodular nonribosomal peptide synthase [Paraburkholderia domus]